MSLLRAASIAPALLAVSAPAAVQQPPDPLGFFVGRTEGFGQVKVMFQRSYATHNIGVGRIEPDGSLFLVQQVFDEGKPATQRFWRVRRIAPGHYTGTMTDAVGPVTIDKTGSAYRFHFAMKGNLNVDEMLVPLAGGRAASSSAEVRKFGLVVATTQGIERKL